MNGLATLLALLIVSSHSVFASVRLADYHQSMIRELDFIRNAFETKYAPALWKKEFAGWDLLTEIDRAKHEVLYHEGCPIKHYQRSLLRFLRSTQDYHVGAFIYSTEAARLPFELGGSQGRYFITQVDEDYISEKGLSLKVGDELILFNSQPINEAVKKFKEQELGHQESLTDQALAEMFLTQRTASQGHIVPKGEISLTVKSCLTGLCSSMNFEWDHVPEMITNPLVSALSPGVIDHSSLLRKKMIAPFFEQQLKKDSLLRPHPHAIGTKASFLPPLGRKLWESTEEDPFHAYLFTHPTNKRVIGYVRLPHYVGDYEDVIAFAELIARFERKTDALVIDQVNNPGGFVFYLYALASLLTDVPLGVPYHRVTLTQESAAQALAAIDDFEEIESDEEAHSLLGPSIQGYPVDYAFVQSVLEYFRFLVKEWNSGETLTSPYPLFGIREIQPHPSVTYTKPILVLINELDFSGGDFFPAILQDNKRAVLFGSRTAGAGGYVEAFSYPNPFGIGFIHYTGSIAERKDSRPIENLGVDPDIPYELTERDYQENYKDYRQAVLRAILSIL